MWHRRQNRPHQRPKRQAAVGGGVDQGLEAHTVANQKDLAFVPIQNGKGKHPAQFGQEAFKAPGFITPQNKFGVGVCFELNTLLAQRVSVRLPIVDFTVVTKPDAAIVVTKGLVGLRTWVHDGEARMDERCLWSTVVALPLRIPPHHMLGIRPATAQRGQHRFQRGWCQRLLTDDARNTAHS